MNLIAKDPLQKRLEIANWIILAVLFILSVIIAPIKFALGILIGGFISIVNFHWMERGLQGFLKKTSGNTKGPIMIKYYLRLAITAVVLFFLISNETVHVIGLIIGLSVVMINIILTLIISAAKKNFIEEVS
ncbi:MAG: ATP synthase subunit I [Smithellaceae bacterium]|nr:ATP synthase subunit I [Smithellaceae bacterium]